MSSGKTISVIRYTPDKKEVWDQFIRSSRNGTFLLERNYMEYHADRFQDHSLLFYAESRLAAVIPAHQDGDRFCSHNGLTYGGLIVDNKTTAQLTLEIFDALIAYLKEHGVFSTMIYKPSPFIYHRYPAEEDLYAIMRHDTRLIGRKISSVVQQSNPLSFSTLRRRKLNMAKTQNFIVYTNHHWEEFWKMLEDTLSDKHHATPVHSFDEIKHLHELFPKNVRLFTITSHDGELMGGTVLYTTDRVAHAQYIASTERGRNRGALDFLFDYLIHVRFRNREYFDLGTSVEDGGRMLNEGLIFQKEGFGGRAVVYDTYEINIKTT